MNNAPSNAPRVKDDRYICSTLPPLRATKFAAFIGGLLLGVALTMGILLFVTVARTVVIL